MTVGWENVFECFLLISLNNLMYSRLAIHKMYCYNAFILKNRHVVYQCR